MDEAKRCTATSKRTGQRCGLDGVENSSERQAGDRRHEQADLGKGSEISFHVATRAMNRERRTCQKLFLKAHGLRGRGVRVHG